MNQIDYSLARLVSIGISTKDRWEDLYNTLTKICDLGWHDIPVVIFDDGSNKPCPFDLKHFQLKIELKRFQKSCGLISRRNQIAKVIQTKYYLSIDDDSYPATNSLEAVIQFAESQNDLLGLSFPIYNPRAQKYQNPSLWPDIYQVKSFIGCGHLLHIPHFLQIGGYQEALFHQGEEMEIAARAFHKKLYCYHFPGFEIYHTESPVSRNWQRMDYYGARNNILWNDWFTPPSHKYIQQLRTFSSRLLLAIKVRRNGQIRGGIAGLREITKYSKYRQSMSLEQFKAWKALPYS